MRSYFKYTFCLRNGLLSGKNISSSVRLKIKLSFTGCEGKKSIKGNSSNDSKSAKKHGSDGLLFFC